MNTNAERAELAANHSLTSADGQAITYALLAIADAVRGAPKAPSRPRALLTDEEQCHLGEEIAQALSVIKVRP